MLDSNPVAALYRLALREAAQSIHVPFPTPRLPLNVPYLVDNLWEWARPEHFPSRRWSVYASPSAEIARLSGSSEGKDVFVVDIDDPKARIVQIPYNDARLHPDVRALPTLLVECVGRAWLGEAALDERAEIAALWMPGLSREDTEAILQRPRLASHRGDLLSHIDLWRDARVVDSSQEWPSKEGEVFFQAQRWRLRCQS